MGSLRRTGTVSVIETVQEVVVQDSPIQEAVKPSLELLDRDFGICRISFQCDIAELPGTPHLRFSFNSGVKAGTPEEIDQIKAVLNQVQKSGEDFVTTFDFREHQRPNMRLLGPALATFSDKKAKTWARRCRAVALVTEGNVFASMANGAVASFVEGAGLSVSPLVMCHQDNIAAEFFKEVADSNVSGACTSSFVSVTGVQDLASGCYSFLCPCNPSRQSNSGKGQDAVGKEQASVEAPGMAMHTLDNGDVRVIQSPPSDVMVLRQHLAKVGIRSTAANTKEASTDKQQRQATNSGQNANAIEGVFFKCTSRTIKCLLGISFHLGEMLIDADSESCFQRGENIVVSRGNTCNKGSGGPRCTRYGGQRCTTRGPYTYTVAPKAWGLRKGGCLSGARLLYSMICS
mmetsp:Transcript_7832/g.14236  ORF Transcript_7832/g.14236 Transcript_7832/m.14236 type:complete len:403 (-) Transcript_7832:63-1271(-)